MRQQTILLIEDEPDMILLMDTRLRAGGFEVISAMDGEAGLAKAEAEQPDLVLLDLRIPKIHGLEVCKRLKTAPTTRAIPIVVFTASVRGELETQCLAAGAEAIVRKPFQPAQVLATIRSLLPAA